MSWLDQLRGPSLALGAIALLLAGAAALVAGELSVASRIALAAAVLLFGLYVAIDPGKAVQALKARQWVYGSNVVALSVAFVGILVLINVLAVRFHHRWDLTAQRDFSLSDATLRVLADLPQPVRAKGFFSAGLFDRQKTEDLLKEYEARSGGKLTWEMVDTFQQPALADLEKINVDGTVLFIMGDRRQTTITTDEAHLTTALLKLVNPTQLKVYYLTGHGERDLDRFDDRGYSELKTQVQRDNYVMEELNLFARQEVPQDAAALVIAAPRTALLPEELDAINRFIDRKGKLVLLVDGLPSESNVTELLKRWDLTVGNGVVIDPDSALPRDPAVLIVQQYGVHSISKDLGTISVFPSSTNVEIPQFIRRGVDVISLAQTSGNRSWLETDRSFLEFTEGADKRGPLTLAVAVEEIENPEVQEETLPGFESTLKRVKNRAVVVGSSEFAGNGLLNQPFANRDFFLNSLNWVTETDQLITTRPRIPERRPLFLTPIQANFVFFSGTMFLPVILLGIGGVVWWTRR